MAHKKGASSTKNGRDSRSKRLGLKITSGSFLRAGQIIFRQRGLKLKPGKNIGLSKDFTLYAKKSGILSFQYSFHKIRFLSII